MKKTLKDLTTEEKLRLICGKDCWHTCDFDGKLPYIRVTDSSMGIRMPVNPESWDGVKPSVAYPSLQMLANTWDLETVRTYAECVADDCLDNGADILLGPGVNIKRSPLCGRNFEYFSEDPFLAGTLAKQYIAALQSEGAGACVKHFCCNNLEYNRLQQSSEVDERAFREIYYKPFEMAVQAKPVSLMSSYNRINGVLGSEYKKGYKVLREEYGFDGLIMSDWDAVRDRTKAALAGCDLEMPYHPEHYEALVADFKAGKITEEEIDVCAQRVLDLVSRCKQLQEGKTRKHTQKERIAFTQKAEEEGIVLLKNNGVLPLKKGQSLSMCGWFARPCAYDRKKPELISGGGSGWVERITPMFDMLEIMQRVHGGKIGYEPAFSDDGVDSSFMIPGNAVDNAAESDVNIVFAGTGAHLESEGGDRQRMTLCDAVRTILDTAAVNKNTVVVLFAGSPIDMSEWIDEVAAVVYVGFPGEMGGEAIANVLTGKVNPSGKLTETFPLAYEDTPAAKCYADTKITRYEEGLDVGYRYYDTYGVPVLFPFGYGLSYSKFEYSEIKLVQKDCFSLEVCYNVSNTSDLDGKEVSEVYVRAMSSYVYRPYKELKGFAKTLVKAGKTEKIKVVLDKHAFEYWSVSKNCWDIEDGVYEIIVGASVADEKLSAKIKIKGGKIFVL